MEACGLVQKPMSAMANRN